MRVGFVCVLLCVVFACDGKSSGAVTDAGPHTVVDAAMMDAAKGGDTGLPFDAASGKEAGARDAGMRADAAASGDAGRRDANTGSEDDEDAATPDDPKDHALAALCSDCGSGEKVCGGQCVSAHSAAYGCGNSECTACKLDHAVAACGDRGACAIGACEPGWADCDDHAANGCEADLSSPDSCGGCGQEHACGGPTELCGPSGCVSSCVPPLTQCGDRCVDLLSSPSACGSCNATCTTHDDANESGFPSCELAQCGRACAAGYSECEDHCVDLSNTKSACGACGHACSLDQVCSSGVCVAPACQAGWKHCDGSCVAPQVDRMNCGRCGRSCGADQSCVSGTCVATSSQWLQTGLKDPLDLIVEGDTMYWIEQGEVDGKIVSSPKSGGAVTSLATAQRRPKNLVADATHVYWSNNLGGAIMRAPKDGSAAASLVTAATSPGVIAVDGSFLYLPRDGGIDRVAKTGGTPMSFATLTGMTRKDDVLAMLPDAGSLYVLIMLHTPWQVYQVDSSGDPTLVREGDNKFVLPMLRMDAESIYYADYVDPRYYAGVSWFDKQSGAPRGSVWSLPSGVDSQTLNVETFAVADCGVFWTDGQDIYLGRNGRPDQAALAHGQVRALALDAAHLYWTDGSGAIGRVPRP